MAGLLPNRLQADSYTEPSRRLFPALGRRETPAHDVLGDGAREEEILQVLAAAGFRATAAQLEAAEGMTFDDRTGDAAVEVEIADEQFALGAFECARAAREKPA